VHAWSTPNDKGQEDYEVFDEYIVYGDNINNWFELITIQFHPRLNNNFDGNISLDALETMQRATLTQICPI
jgi:hypothetical protein